MKRLFALLMIFSLALALVGCSDDTLNPGNDDDATDPAKVVTVDNGDGTFTTTVAAGFYDATEWVYFSFASPEQVTPTDPANSTAWDLAFKFANILVNGGANGTAAVAVFPFDDADFALLDTEPDAVFLTDSGTDDPGQCFNAGGGWYDYDFVTHVMTIHENRYYAVRLADGSCVKLKMTAFVDGAGTPGYPAFTWAVIASGDYGVRSAVAGDLGSTSVVAAGDNGGPAVYFSFITGLQATQVDPGDSSTWDLAFSYADIAINGGFNGTGGVEVAVFDDGAYGAMIQAPVDGYSTDTGDGGDDADLVFNSGDGWYSYDHQTHVVSILGDRYYVVHSVDDGYFKIQLTGFATDQSGQDAHVSLNWEEILAP